MHNELEGSQMIALKVSVVDKDVRWSYGIVTFCYVFPFFNFMSKRVRNRVQTPHFEWQTRTHLLFGVLKAPRTKAMGTNSSSVIGNPYFSAG